jgi:hypothetical protein
MPKAGNNINACRWGIKALNTKRNIIVNQNTNAKELEAEKKAQERVTKPLHREEIPIFLRNSIVSQKSDAPDEKDKNVESFLRINRTKTFTSE